MKKRDKITVERFFKMHEEELGLELLAGARGLDRLIREATVNRPGLILAGFTRYFATNRFQVVGNAEVYFLRTLPEKERLRRYNLLLSYKVPCVVYCRGHQPDAELLSLANATGVPIFRSRLVTMHFINQATLHLEALFAPHGSELGSMVDILGIGVIVRGESGVGKSECVLALLERGYSLVSDDVTHVRLFEGREVIGTSPSITQGFMEVRGIGIIDVRATFGIRSLRTEKRVDLVITLKPWERVPDVDRLGMDDETTPVLGVAVPHVIIPVRPGRDIARLVEVAALHTRLKTTGYNPAEALNKRIIEHNTAVGARQITPTSPPQSRPHPRRHKY